MIERTRNAQSHQRLIRPLPDGLWRDIETLRLGAGSCRSRAHDTQRRLEHGELRVGPLRDVGWTLLLA